jgi:hypothetical protein
MTTYVSSPQQYAGAIHEQKASALSDEELQAPPFWNGTFSYYSPLNTAYIISPTVTGSPI